MKTKNRIWIYPLTVIGFLLMAASSSKKDENLPDYASILNTGSIGNNEKVTICHNPCTPHQKTLVIPVQALAAHLSHGDEIGECATTDVEYIISHSPDPNDPIFVDNYLRVFVNGNLMVEVMGGGRCCPPVPPIHFIGNSGDILRIQAQDHDVCFSLESLWLQKREEAVLFNSPQTFSAQTAALSHHSQFSLIRPSFCRRLSLSMDNCDSISEL